VLLQWYGAGHGPRHGVNTGLAFLRSERRCALGSIGELHPLMRAVRAAIASTHEFCHDARVRSTRRSDTAVPGMSKHALAVSTCCPGKRKEHDGCRG
jgi:hypothetical protein